jgi:hypothetical protein
VRLAAVALAAAAAALLGGAAPLLRVVPAGPEFAAAADEYRAIWEEDGPRIVAALEQASGLAFPPGEIEALVSQAPPMMAYDGRSMRLRAGYSPAYKRATLVHELGHRLAFLLPRGAGLDDHRLLYLFLYDTWTDLYGEAFAIRMSSIESSIPGPYDYDAAWRWALAMSREERQARLAALRSGRGA